jgi:hypothetical protein
MNAKTMTFQPAPRPQPRLSPEQTRELAAATRDLGFGRTTSAPGTEAAEAALPTPSTPPVAPSTPPPSTKGGKSAEPAAGPLAERMAMLKVAVPDELWAALRHEALNRRVTVKYLVMEALAAKGYDIDLSKVAEDGRRLR